MIQTLIPSQLGVGKLYRCDTEVSATYVERLTRNPGERQSVRVHIFVGSLRPAMMVNDLDGTYWWNLEEVDWGELAERMLLA